MVAWHRPAEVVALSFVTAIFVEQIHRRPVLDSLGDDLQTEVVGEVDDGPDDDGVILDRAHRGDERSVGFDLDDG